MDEHARSKALTNWRNFEMVGKILRLFSDQLPFDRSDIDLFKQVKAVYRNGERKSMYILVAVLVTLNHWDVSAENRYASQE